VLGDIDLEWTVFFPTSEHLYALYSDPEVVKSSYIQEVIY